MLARADSKTIDIWLVRRGTVRVLERVVNTAQHIKLGSGLDPETQMGRLVSARQRDRVLNYIESGVKNGANAAAGSPHYGGQGFFVKPTVLIGAGADATVSQEEIFSPVLVASAFDNMEEVAQLANCTPYGLGASIWSNNLAKVNDLVPRLQAGTVWVNCHNVVDPAMPFGGYKQSGMGREIGQEVIEAYTELKSVCMLT